VQLQCEGTTECHVTLQENFDAVPPYTTDIFPGAAEIYGKGVTFMDLFDQDQHSEKRKINLFYPFASKQDWEVASWLSKSGLSMAAIDNFLSLELVSPDSHYCILLILHQIRQLPLSFHTAKELRHRIEILPSGPQWKCKPWNTIHPTKNSIKLYYRDAIDCLQSIFNNPLFSNHLDFSPFRLFNTAERLIRVFTEWMSGNAAWEMQVYHIYIQVFSFRYTNLSPSIGKTSIRCYSLRDPPVIR
jgi:hypothetical protein